MASYHQAPNALINAIIQQESRGNPNALSPAGAMGLMQIMPATARQPGFGVAPLKNPWNPEENRRFGTDYFNAMLNRYNGDKELALIAYNAGVGNADKFKAAGRDYSALPKQSETKPYVDNILSSFQNSAQQAPMQNNLYTTDPIDLAPSEFQQVAAKTVGPASVPGGPMIPEAPGQAKSSPGWLNRNSDYLLALAAGLLQGQTVGQGLGKAFQNLGTVADRNRGQEFKEQLQKLQLQNLQLRNQTAQSGLNQATQRRNLTLDYLRKQNIPEEQVAIMMEHPKLMRDYFRQQYGIKKDPLVNVDLGKQVSEFDKKLGGKFGEEAVQIHEKASQAEALVPQLATAKEILTNPNVYTGTGGNLIQGLKKMGSTFLGIPLDGVGEGELMQTLQSKFALDDLSMFKGSTTNKELDFAKEMQFGLGRSQRGNELIISLKEDEIRYKQTIRDIYEQHNNGRTLEDRKLIRGKINAFQREFAKEPARKLRELRSMSTGQKSPTAGSEKTMDYFYKKYNLEQ